MNYFWRILTRPATWQAVAGVFNAAAVSMMPPMAPVLQAAINALIVAISGAFIMSDTWSYVAERRSEIPPEAKG